MRNRDITTSYDKEADVFYVSVDTQEPSYSEEIDDVIVLDLGMYTDMPTGFRIIGVSELSEKEKKAYITKAIDLFARRMSNLEVKFQRQEKEIKRLSTSRFAVA